VLRARAALPQGALHALSAQDEEVRRQPLLREGRGLLQRALLWQEAEVLQRRPLL
jgi:hypothetical protein